MESTQAQDRSFSTLVTDSMLIDFSNYNSLVNQYVSEIRNVNVQSDRMRFRYNMQRLGEIMAYEISKKLKYKQIEVETPLGISNVHVPAERIVLATILRAGLPLHQGLLNYFDTADNAFISAYRRHHKDGTFEIHLEYISCPDIDEAVFILSDPMLATGSSIDASLKAILNLGKPSSIHVVTAIASQYGIDYVRRLYPEVKIWAGAIDEELTAKSFIVPGLGDAGDLCFGPKIQE